MYSKNVWSTFSEVFQILWRNYYHNKKNNNRKHFLIIFLEVFGMCIQNTIKKHFT